jgi:cell division GTPase FtsZ
MLRSKTLFPFTNRRCWMDDLLMVGVGGAGWRIASYLQKAVGCPAVAINTDKKSLEQGPLARQLLIGLRTCGGYGANVPARGRRAGSSPSNLSKERSSISPANRIIAAISSSGRLGT